MAISNHPPTGEHPGLARAFDTLTSQRARSLLAIVLLALLLSASKTSGDAPLAVDAPNAVPAARAEQAPGARFPADAYGLAPALLSIPRLKVSAPVVALGPDANGAMQAPIAGEANNPVYRQVYWWDVGALPGQTGNAVIAGHINRPDGSPGIFAQLSLLAIGDHIQITTVGGTILTFTITAKDTPTVYVRGANDPVMGRIFGPALTPNLNLVTCWGKWDGRQYDHRFVISSALVSVAPSATAR